MAGSMLMSSQSVRNVLLSVERVSREGLVQKLLQFTSTKLEIQKGWLKFTPCSTNTATEL